MELEQIEILVVQDSLWNVIRWDMIVQRVDHVRKHMNTRCVLFTVDTYTHELMESMYAMLDNIDPMLVIMSLTAQFVNLTFV